LSERIAPRQAALAEQTIEGGNRRLFPDGFKSFAEEQEARGVVGNGQRIAVLAIAEPELAFEIGTPKVIGRCAGGKGRALGAPARASLVGDEAMAVENGLDGTDRRNLHLPRQPADQQFPQLTRTPVRLVLFEPKDHGLQGLRQLIGVAPGPA